MKTVKVRTVVAEDLPMLSMIDRRIFGHLAYPYFVLRQLFDVHQEEILVADEAGELRGYSIAVRSSAESEPDLALFLALGVDLDHRRYGYGRQLAEDALHGLQRRGVKRVRLAVEHGNAPAIALYEKLGFARIGDEVDYYGENESRLLYELELVPGVHRG